MQYRIVKIKDDMEEYIEEYIKWARTKGYSEEKIADYIASILQPYNLVRPQPPQRENWDSVKAGYNKALEKYNTEHEKYIKQAKNRIYNHDLKENINGIYAFLELYEKLFNGCINAVKLIENVDEIENDLEEMIVNISKIRENLNKKKDTHD